MQLQSIARNTTGYLRSTRHTTPVGLPSFPNPPNRRTEETKVIAVRKFLRKKSESERAKQVNRSTVLGRGEGRHHPSPPSCRGMVTVRRHRSVARVSLSLSRGRRDQRHRHGVYRSRDVGCDPGLLPGGSVGFISKKMES